MRLGTGEIAEDASDRRDGNGTLRMLYTKVIEEVNESGTDYASLWADFAPSGNVYRYMGFVSERLKHCADLQRQMEDLAGEYYQLLGGVECPLQLRVATLRSALKHVQVSQSGSDEAALPSGRGFSPIAEFIGDRDQVTQVGPFLIPADPAEKRKWRKIHTIGCIILAVQTFSPLFVFIENWRDTETNQFLRNGGFPGNVSMEEFVCIGKRLSDKLTTILGTLFLILVIQMCRDYAERELGDVMKAVRLPSSNFWRWVGNFANQWCVLWTVLAMPLLFWNQDTPSSIALNSLALIFVFTLDDLGSGVIDFINVDDATFQKIVSYNLALLSRCPVKLRDLINPHAQRVDDLWDIRLDIDGRPLVAQSEGEPCTVRIEASDAMVTPGASPRASPREAPEAVELTSAHSFQKRSSRSVVSSNNHGVAQLERATSHMLDKDSSSSSSLLLRYCTSPSEAAVDLPGGRSFLPWAVWIAISWILWLLHAIIPVVWFLLNKSCADEQSASTNPPALAI